MLDRLFEEDETKSLTDILDIARNKKATVLLQFNSANEVNKIT